MNAVVSARRTLKSLTDEEFKTVSTAIHRVWAQIQSDAGDATNVEAIELCLDADRPQTFAGEAGAQAMAIIDTLEETFTQTLRFFAKRVKLVY